MRRWTDIEAWRLLPFGRYDAYENMAIDEAILRCFTEESHAPTLRLYGWTRPAVSLGCFQEAAESINHEYCRRRGIDIVRRPTGGRAVLHGNDLTYAVVARCDGFRDGIMETYRMLGESISRGLRRAGVAVSMAEAKVADDAPSRRGCCFSVPARHELLAGGRKICGSAQVRTREAFLQHGSIPLSLDVEHMCMIMNPDSAAFNRENEAEKLRERITSVDEHAPEGMTVETLCRSMAEGFEESLGIRLAPGALSDGEERAKKRLLTEKYRTERWNREGWLES